MDTVANVFSSISSVATNVISQMGQWLEAIFEEPVLLIAFLLPVCGIGIGLLKRLLRVHL